ncbi:MAG: NRDE family protein [Polaromonas sp.]
MCLIAFAIGASQRWPLVIASNRDEFLSRPTLPLAKWETASGQEIISGRDLRAGGTWLGMTPEGRVAFLTNVRAANPKTALFSRGELVTRWLETNGDAEGFTASLGKEDGAYAGFNLVLGDVQRNAWTWLTNKSTETLSGWHVQALKPGVYGLSNAALDTPWPKTLELKRVLTAALHPETKNHDLDSLQRSLWAALANRHRAHFGQLPETGASQEMEQALSSAFVEFPEYAYGTRSSTLLVASRKEDKLLMQSLQIDVREQTYLRQANNEITEIGATVALSFAC